MAGAWSHRPGTTRRESLLRCAVYSQTAVPAPRASRKRRSDDSSCPRTRVLLRAPAALNENADRNWLRCESDREESVFATTTPPAPLWVGSHGAAVWPASRQKSRCRVSQETLLSQARALALEFGVELTAY